MRHTKSREVQALVTKRWVLPSDHAKAFVRTLMCFALGGSATTAGLVFEQMVTGSQRVDTVGVLLLAGLILGACWISRIMHEIKPPRRRRQDYASQPPITETVPPKNERDVRGEFKRC